jgi:hypothetical protein
MTVHSPDYDAYLDDPDDTTTGFGYGLDPDADTPAADEPDPMEDVVSSARSGLDPDLGPED